MARVRAGRLNTRILIAEHRVNKGASGAESMVWCPLLDVWAEEQSVSERTRLAAQAAGAVRSMAYLMYRDNRIDSTMRLTVGSRHYAIESIQYDGDSMTLLCGGEVQACQRHL